MTKDFLVPRQWVRDASPLAERPNGGRGARGAAAAGKAVTERSLESGMKHVHATARMPDGTMRVWGEAGGSDRSSNLRKFNDGWERTFGR